jgi:hypothetical protein
MVVPQQGHDMKNLSSFFRTQRLQLRLAKRPKTVRERILRLRPLPAPAGERNDDIPKGK